MNFINDERGVTSIEFGIIVSLMALVIFVGIEFLGLALSEHYSDVANAVKDA